MQEETLLLTQDDRDRLKVLHEVRKGHITQRQAAGQLKLTDRWIRELVERIREKGDKAVMHGLRGARSKRKIAEKIEKQAMEIVGREYADFGPTLASEYLVRDHQITAIRATVRQRMLRSGIWTNRHQNLDVVHEIRTRWHICGDSWVW